MIILKKINCTEFTLNALQKNSYDLILMDCHMPVMDGFTATNQIRKLKINTPIIAMTASVFNDDREKCFRYGMNDFIAKPIDIKVLTNILEHWLLKQRVA